MRTTLFLIIAIISLQLNAQKKFTLSECQQKAMANHPAGLKKAELEKINILNLDIIKSSYLPEFQINGMATYQSDVIDLGINVPGINIPSPAKDQYKMSLDINQMIYDGGITKSRKDVQKASLKTELQQVELELFSIKKSVNKFFFLHFILKDNLELLQNAKNVLSKKLSSVISGVENGVLLNSDLLTLEVEIIRLEQKIEDVELSLNSSLEILEILTKENLKNKEFSLPENPTIAISESNRPENLLFQYQKENLKTVAQLKKIQNRPKIFGFAQLGYGKPGLNLMSETFDFYYITGVKFSWKIWDWEKQKKESNILKLKADIVDFNEAAFEQNQKIMLANAQKEIVSLERKIDKDQKIIKLQKQILEIFSSQLSNGIITSTDYLTKFNAVSEASINLNTHKIKLIEAIINYNNIKGN